MLHSNQPYRVLAVFVCLTVLAPSSEAAETYIFSGSPAGCEDHSRTISESEPNDSPGTADSTGTAGNGELPLGYITPIGDRDWWVVSNIQVGDRVFGYADVSGAVVGEALLKVYADDPVTPVEDPYWLPDIIANVIVPQSGRVFFRMGDQSDNDELGT